MAKYVRANAWNHGGTFDNPDLLWYAKGVRAMQARALDDLSGWWSFAAIHGEYVTPASLKQKGVFPWKDIPAPPAVPTTPLPAAGVSDRFWDQCQHQSWYFAPWHRGYLLALEAQIRAAVVKLGGPSTWALPYWDYFGTGNVFQIPPAFTQETMPDGSPNPLYVKARFGPDSDSNIYVPTPAGIQQHPHDPNFSDGPVIQDCLSNDLYTGHDRKTKAPGFGGPETKFSHGGGTSGNLEGNPHNHVHVYVGGDSQDGNTPGLMSDPGLAALDPIFYLHHANIDRMWAVWNGNTANKNPADTKWLNGPAAAGDREFVMPMPDGKAWVYTPQQMSSLAQLDYTYDNLPALAPAADPLPQRLTRLKAGAEAAKVAQGAAVTPGDNMELVGASQGALAIQGPRARTAVKLDAAVRRKVSASLARASASEPPDRVYLSLDNVRGTRDACVLGVYVDLPEGARPADHPELFAGSVSLFGLTAASAAEGKHGGAGLNFILDITNIVDTLHLKNALDVESLPVTIVPRRAVPEAAQISVGRISIYREGR